MCDKYVRILHTCDRIVKFVERQEFGLVLAQLDIMASLIDKFHSNSSGNAIIRLLMGNFTKSKPVTKRPNLSTDRIFFSVLAQLGIEANTIGKFIRIRQVVSEEMR